MFSIFSLPNSELVNMVSKKEVSEIVIFLEKGKFKTEIKKHLLPSFLYSRI